MKLALLTEIPAPYRIPLFNALAAREGVDLRVLFLSDRDPKRPYPVYANEFAFAHIVLGRLDVSARGRWVAVNRGVGRELRRFDPDAVIVGGWNQPAFWQALLWARLRGKPVLVWVESTLRDDRPDARSLSIAKRLVVRSAAGFLVPGRASLAYLESLGVAGSGVTVAPNAVDTAIFGDRVAALAARREEVRAELGLDGFVALYVGRLDPEKGVDVLIEAFKGIDGRLVIVGAGSREAELRDLGDDRIRFVGRVERDALPAWYAAADVFVLPSLSEPWGLVLNEALAAGLPLVASEAAGATCDMVEHGENGFRVRAGDAGAIRDALVRLEDHELRRGARRRSLELAQRFTPDLWADAVERGARRYIVPRS